jgi:plastocyanin
MKKLLLALFILSSFSSKGTIHTIGVWGGYYQFVPASITIQLGDTLEWEPFAGLLPMMLHTITSDNIPVGAVSFDQVWQMPADTFFQYIPQVAGLYQYVCTPHIPNGMIAEFTVTNVGNTQTYVPDDNFESYLEANGMGNGIPNDEYVTTANIDTITSLDVDNLNISDLTGIEDFSALNYLNCDGNQLTSLDVSQNTVLYVLECGGNNLIKLDLSNNPNLEELHCPENLLNCLNLKSGGNQNIYHITADDQDALSLSCVEVDDLAYSNSNWISNPDFYFDIGVSFSENCNNDCSNSSTLVLDIGHKNKILLKTIDIFGRETKQTNQLVFYIYDDGTVEKRINIE